MHLSPATSAVTSLAGMVAVLAWRVQEGRRAVTLKKILIPPLGMATGFSMFIVPAFRVPLLWALAAFLIGGIVLAYPLLLTSRLERDGDAIMMRRSSAFLIVIVVLALIFCARLFQHPAHSGADRRSVFHPRLRNDPALARRHVLRIPKTHCRELGLLSRAVRFVQAKEDPRGLLR